MANFLIQGQKILKPIRDLMNTYMLTKFGADWLIFVDARQKNCGWMDGHRRTMCDYNSSLSTPCLGEIKTHFGLKRVEKIQSFTKPSGPMFH